MTREHKLSLIIGFVLILIVGVLISDHMSKARSTQLASVAVDDERSTLGVGDGISPVERWVRENAAEIQAAAKTEPAPPALDDTSLAMQANAAPEQSSQPDAPAQDDGFAPVVIPNGSLARQEDESGNMGRALEESGAIIRSTPSGEQVMSIPETQGGAAPRTEPSLGSRPDPVSADRTPKADVDPKDVKVYRIQDKDSLYGIAKSTYGDASLWTALAAYNEGRVGKDGTVRVGATIKLPPKHVLTGGAPEPASTRQASKTQSEKKAADQPAKKTEVAKTPTKAPTNAPAKTPGKTTTHKVVKGDTLSKLAEKYLGSKSRAAEIMALNKITDPNQIKLGSVLKIPAK